MCFQTENSIFVHNALYGILQFTFPVFRLYFQEYHIEYQENKKRHQNHQCVGYKNPPLHCPLSHTVNFLKFAIRKAIISISFLAACFCYIFLFIKHVQIIVNCINRKLFILPFHPFLMYEFSKMIIFPNF